MSPNDSDTRRLARERALGLLYEAEAKGVSVGDVLADLPLAPDPLATLLAVGAADHLAEIDALVRTHATGWTLERMASLDRAVLRIATFELLHRPDTSVAVVINEAVELAKRFSTDDSGRFVNGVLSAIAAEVRV